MAEEHQEAQLSIGWDPDASAPAPTYSNYVQVTFTPEDFTMQLGWYAVPVVKDLPADGILRAPVQPVARVTFPVNLMRNIVGVMQKQIEAYEANFGKIPEHPNPPPWLQESQEKAAKNA